MHKNTQPAARIRAALSIFALGGLVAVTGCEKKEDVRTYSAPKDGGSAAAPAGSSQATGKEVQWTVPAGWKELPPQPMRTAGFGISAEDPSAIFTVIPLPKSPLVENVNRWEKQVGSPPSGAEQVEKMVRHADLPGGHADIVDLTGPEPTDGKKRQRIIGAMIERGPQIWFFKMTAPAEIAEAQKGNFEAFMTSVRFAGPAPAGGHDHAHDHDHGHDHAPKPGAAPAGPATPMTAPAASADPSAAPATTAPAASASPAAAASGGPEKLAKYDAPEAWVKETTPRPMRLMTFKLSGPNKPDEVTVIKLSKNSTGELLPNVNRWRTQVGLPPVESANEKDVPRVTIGGQEAMLFDFAGPEATPTKRQILAVAKRGSDVWYFKLIGDAKVVESQAEAFKKYLASIEFAPE